MTVRCPGACNLPLEVIPASEWLAKPSDYRDRSIHGCHRTMLGMDPETGATILRHVAIEGEPS